jgi:hypothetical protein
MIISGYHVVQGITDSVSGYRDIEIPTGFAVKKMQPEYPLCHGK